MSLLIPPLIVGATYMSIAMTDPAWHAPYYYPEPASFQATHGANEFDNWLTEVLRGPFDWPDLPAELKHHIIAFFARSLPDWKPTSEGRKQHFRDLLSLSVVSHEMREIVNPYLFSKLVFNSYDYKRFAHWFASMSDFWWFNCGLCHRWEIEGYPEGCRQKIKEIHIDLSPAYCQKNDEDRVSFGKEVHKITTFLSELQKYDPRIEEVYITIDFANSLDLDRVRKNLFKLAEALDLILRGPIGLHIHWRRDKRALDERVAPLHDAMLPILDICGPRIRMLDLHPIFFAAPALEHTAQLPILDSFTFTLKDTLKEFDVAILTHFATRATPITVLDLSHVAGDVNIYRELLQVVSPHLRKLTMRQQVTARDFLPISGFPLTFPSLVELNLPHSLLLDRHIPHIVAVLDHSPLQLFYLGILNPKNAVTWMNTIQEHQYGEMGWKGLKELAFQLEWWRIWLVEREGGLKVDYKTNTATWNGSEFLVRFLDKQDSRVDERYDYWARAAPVRRSTTA
ncbi:hypothetical protein BT69DRAFT_1317068 [Atractiella rhizophila]|nr:hypothetical protein BT69DRAFT_1317068 [Atractiella rhizophila]